MPKNYYTFIWGPKILRKSTVMGWWGGRSRFDTLKPLITSDLINLRPMAKTHQNPANLLYSLIRGLQWGFGPKSRCRLVAL